MPLVLIHAEGPPQAHVVTTGHWTLGAGQGCDLSLAAQGLAEVHLSVERGPEGAYRLHLHAPCRADAPDGPLLPPGSLCASPASLWAGEVSLTYLCLESDSPLASRGELCANVSSSDAELLSLRLLDWESAAREGAAAAASLTRRASLLLAQAIPWGAQAASCGRGAFLIALQPGNSQGLVERLVDAFAQEDLRLARIGVASGGGPEAAEAACYAPLDTQPADLGLPQPAGSLAEDPRARALLSAVEYLLASPLDPVPFLQLLLGFALAHSRAERGAVFRAQDGRDPELLVSCIPSQHLATQAFSASRSLVRESLRSGAPVRIADALGHASFGQRQSVVQARLRSLLVVPLSGPGASPQVALYLDNNSSADFFTARDEAHLQALARLVRGPLALSFRRSEALAERTDQRLPPRTFGPLYGSSRAFHRLIDHAERFAQTALPIALSGETGTGKLALTRAIHAASTRRAGPFVVLDCRAIPEELLESQLFGHKAGSFTGASEDFEGLFPQANGGTLALTGVDSASQRLQASLLRALENGEIRPVGGQVRRIDLRLISTSRAAVRSS